VLGVAIAAIVVFMMIGLFLLYTTLDSNSHEAKGFAGALRLIQRQSYGSIWAGVPAAGLLAFRIYELAEAALDRITTPSLRQAATKAASQAGEEHKRCWILEA
jgi:hypothetical protein